MPDKHGHAKGKNVLENTNSQACGREDEHDHVHEHSHDGHSHGITGEKDLLRAVILNFAITAAEIIGGLLSGSLALLSDAFHNLSDAISLIISYIALLIGKRSKSATKTYGYKRAEILAALGNVIVLFFVSGFIIYEAVIRISRPAHINIVIMLCVAFVGVLGNGMSVAMLIKGAKSNMNIKSSLLHLLGDTFSSVAVILTAVILMFKPWYILDTVISIAISLYIIKESLSILLDSINILMQGVPKGLDKTKIKDKIYSLKGLGIRDIHHIHMWDITPGKTVFDAHIVVDKKNLKDADHIIEQVNHALSNDFHISHSTIQIESENFNHCVTCDL